MATVNMSQARSQLSRLVREVETGSEAEVVITRNGRAIAKLVRVNCGIRLGVAQGKFAVPEDLDEENAAIANMFEV